MGEGGEEGGEVAERRGRRLEWEEGRRLRVRHCAHRWERAAEEENEGEGGRL